MATDTHPNHLPPPADPGRRAKVQKQALVKAKDADERAMAQASVPALLAYIVRNQGITGQFLVRHCVGLHVAK